MQRLQGLGKQDSQKLRRWHEQFNEKLGQDTMLTQYASLSNEPANLPKHARNADEPIVFEVNAVPVAVIILVAIFDYVEPVRRQGDLGQPLWVERAP